MTKIFFRILFLELSLLTFLLITSCSFDEHPVYNDEESIQNGYEFPVTIYALSGSSTTRASYDVERMKLSFNVGDQLLVSGVHSTAGKFAGKLTWTSGILFEGLLRTEKPFTGNAYNLLGGAVAAVATLLPYGYDLYGYLSTSGSGCATVLGLPTMTKAFADTKARGVEQFSYVRSDSYTHGFMLSPRNAILCCNVKRLAANKQYSFTVTDGTHSPSGTVTTDGSGEATFTVAFTPDGSKDYSIQIGEGTEYYDIGIGTRSVVSGCIYNISTNAEEIE